MSYPDNLNRHPDAPSLMVTSFVMWSFVAYMAGYSTPNFFLIRPTLMALLRDQQKERNGGFTSELNYKSAGDTYRYVLARKERPRAPNT